MNRPKISPAYKMKVSDSVSIVVLAKYPSVPVFAIPTEVVDVTEKAVKLEATTGKNETKITAWFPRKSLATYRETSLNDDENHYTVQLSHWFYPEGWTKKFLEISNKN